MKKHKPALEHLALALQAARKGKNRKAAKHLAAAANSPSAKATLGILQATQNYSYSPNAAWPFASGSPEARFRIVRAQLQRIRAAVCEVEGEFTKLHDDIRDRRLEAFDGCDSDDDDEDFDMSEFGTDDDEDEFAEFEDELEDTLADELDETEFGEFAEFAESEQVQVAEKAPRKSAKKPTRKSLKA